MRTVTGNLRLGIADMTVLDALAIAYGGGKENRELIERAYNLSSDWAELQALLSRKVSMESNSSKSWSLNLYDPCLLNGCPHLKRFWKS